MERKEVMYLAGVEAAHMALRTGQVAHETFSTLSKYQITSILGRLQFANNGPFGPSTDFVRGWQSVNPQSVKVNAREVPGMYGRGMYERNLLAIRYEKTEAEITMMSQPDINLWIESLYKLDEMSRMSDAQFREFMDGWRGNTVPPINSWVEPLPERKKKR